MYKVVTICALLAVANAAPADHQATSSVSFNGNHNSVHHIHSAPAPVHYSAPHYAAPAHAVYSATAVTKVALPVVAKVAAPVATSYYSAPKYAAPAAHQAYAAPVFTKVAVPVVAKQVKYSAAPAYVEKEEEYGPAKYEFAYVVEDPHTGDYHSQQEQRDGHHVVGQYSLHEADGTVRLVKYFDEGHGFNAIVERQGHPTEAPAHKKVVAVAVPQYAHH